MKISKDESFIAVWRNMEGKRRKNVLTNPRRSLILPGLGDLCMLLTEEEAKARIESPLNLLNRLRTVTNPERSSPCLPPSSTEVIENLEEKIAFGSIKSKATGIMSAAMDELKARLPEVHKPEKLAAIAAEMSKVVNGTKNISIEDNRKIAQVIIYAPQVLSEEVFDIVEVSE